MGVAEARANLRDHIATSRRTRLRDAGIDVASLACAGRSDRVVVELDLVDLDRLLDALEGRR